MSRLPLDPRIGRIILLGCICGCGPAMIATSAGTPCPIQYTLPYPVQLTPIRTHLLIHHLTPSHPHPLTSPYPPSPPPPYPPSLTPLPSSRDPYRDPFVMPALTPPLLPSLTPSPPYSPLPTHPLAMGYRDPFVMPANDQQRAICNAAKANLAQGLPSDQIALLKAMEGFNTGS